MPLKASQDIVSERKWISTLFGAWFCDHVQHTLSTKTSLQLRMCLYFVDNIVIELW